MHLYAQHAGEFVKGNNTLPLFHFINFLLCKTVLLCSFQEAGSKIQKWVRANQRTQMRV